jgi:hypothetical protein
MKRLLTFCTIAIFLFHTTEGLSDDFQKGWDAYKRGDYATAVREWKLLAKKIKEGDAP